MELCQHYKVTGNYKSLKKKKKTAVVQWFIVILIQIVSNKNTFFCTSRN